VTLSPFKFSKYTLTTLLFLIERLELKVGIDESDLSDEVARLCKEVELCTTI